MITATSGPKGMYLLERQDPEFDAAWKLLIGAGFDAGAYMYMYSMPAAHYFKHHLTRKYIVIPKGVRG